VQPAILAELFFFLERLRDSPLESVQKPFPRLDNSYVCLGKFFLLWISADPYPSWIFVRQESFSEIEQYQRPGVFGIKKGRVFPSKSGNMRFIAGSAG